MSAKLVGSSQLLLMFAERTSEQSSGRRARESRDPPGIRRSCRSTLVSRKAGSESKWTLPTARQENSHDVSKMHYACYSASCFGLPTVQPLPAQLSCMLRPIVEPNRASGGEAIPTEQSALCGAKGRERDRKAHTLCSTLRILRSGSYASRVLIESMPQASEAHRLRTCTLVMVGQWATTLCTCTSLYRRTCCLSFRTRAAQSLQTSRKGYSCFHL